MLDLDLLRVVLLPLAIFIFGSIIGSFLNAEALNFFSKRKHRSQCDSCGTTLQVQDLVPILSFIFLGGRCRHCKKSFSIRYFLSELFCGLFFVLAYLKFGIGIWLGIVLLVFAVSFLASLIDLKTQFLPDKILLPFGLFLALFYIFNGYFDWIEVGEGFDSWWAGLLVGGSALLIIFALTLGRGIGFGDVKFAAILGITLGGAKTLLMLFFAFILGALIGITLITLGKATRKTAIPFGPFILLGWMIAILFGDNILAWYNM